MKNRIGAVIVLVFAVWATVSMPVRDSGPLMVGVWVLGFVSGAALGAMLCVVLEVTRVAVMLIIRGNK